MRKLIKTLKRFWKRKLVSKRAKRILKRARKAIVRLVGNNMAKKTKKIKAKKVDKVARAAKKYAAGTLHTGSKKGPLVKSKAQALAIGYAEKRAAKKK
jgi:hypothetical protein